MNFSGDRRGDELEINLIPLIDVLLVMLIFLAATTSFARFSQLQINLPQAGAEQPAGTPLEVAISQDGRYALDGELLDADSAAGIATALQRALDGRPQPLLVINADALASHQSVVNVMEAARQAGIERVTFATQIAQ